MSTPWALTRYHPFDGPSGLIIKTKWQMLRRRQSAPRSLSSHWIAPTMRHCELCSAASQQWGELVG